MTIGQGFLEDLIGHFRALAATGGTFCRLFELPETAHTRIDSLADIRIGDSITKTNVHSAFLYLTVPI